MLLRIGRVVSRVQAGGGNGTREENALGLRRVRFTEFSPIVRYLRATKPPSARSEVNCIPKREARESRI